MKLYHIFMALFVAVILTFFLMALTGNLDMIDFETKDEAIAKHKAFCASHGMEYNLDVWGVVCVDIINDVVLQKCNIITDYEQNKLYLECG